MIQRAGMFEPVVVNGILLDKKADILALLLGGSAASQQQPNYNAAAASVNVQTKERLITHRSQSLNKVQTVVPMPRRPKQTNPPHRIGNDMTVHTIKGFSQ